MEQIYTCEDVAKRYGVKLITVWDWIRRKKLPATKLGNRYYVKERDLKQFESGGVGNA